MHYYEDTVTANIVSWHDIFKSSAQSKKANASLQITNSPRNNWI